MVLTFYGVIRLFESGAAALSSSLFLIFMSCLYFLFQAPSKDAVRDVCVQSHRGVSRRLTENTAATFSIPAGQAAQVNNTNTGSSDLL